MKSYILSKLSKSNMIARMIINNKLTQPIQKTYNTPNIKLEEDIKCSMMNVIGGVYVIQGTKNIDTVLYVSEQLRQKNKISGVLLVTGENINHYQSPFIYLKEELSISNDESSRFMSELVPINSKRCILVIDKFDYLLDHVATKSFLVSLAEDSVLTKLYNVIVCIDSVDGYNDMLTWNNGGKINKCVYKQ